MFQEGVKGGWVFQNRPPFASLARKGLKSWASVFFPWMLILQFNGRKEIVKSIPFFGSNLDCVYDMNSFYHQKKLSNDLFVGTRPKCRFWTSSEIAVLFKLYSLFKFKPSHHSRNGSMCRGGNEHFLALSHCANCNEYRLWFFKGPFFSFSPASCVNWGLLTCSPHLSWLLCAAGGGREL